MQQNRLEDLWKRALQQKKRAIGVEYDGPKALNVVDRYRVILEIFLTRAKSRMARLQVEAAKLNYIKTRLVRGTPEYARLVNDVLTKMGQTIAKTSDNYYVSGADDADKEAKMLSVVHKRVVKELKSVQAAKDQQRQQRKRSGVWTIGLVGYTNAGKTELMNVLLGKEGGKVRDLLFQTLDTTLRQITLPAGRTAVIADSVGFVADLPQFLLQAFHTTIEELLECDVLLHVRDISHPKTEEQKDVVLDTLIRAEVGGKPLIEVWNKIDLMPSLEIDDGVIAISATRGTNVEALRQKIEDHLMAQKDATFVSLPFHPANSGEVRRWLLKNKLKGEIVNCPDDDSLLSVELVARKEELEQFSRLFSK